MAETNTIPRIDSHELDASLASSSSEAMVSDEPEFDTENPLLYPAVQDVIDELKKIVDEQTEGIEIKYTPSGEPILTSAIMAAWSKKVGFAHGRRNTYHNDNTYLYIKSCNQVPREEDIDKVIGTARHLTSLGAIHPESQWGAFKTDTGRVQLFVVSPKLEAWEGGQTPTAEAHADHPSYNPGETPSLEEWFKRIDPTFIPGQPIPEGSLLYHLNWTEASHNNNWGTDKTGTLFPVDVEVLRPNDEPNKNPEPWKPKNPYYVETEYF